MRLICPNCGAQYALADDVIPAAGRDVQCSNCAHTWFETPGASASDTPPEPRKSRPVPPPPPADAGPFDGPISDAFAKDDVEDKLAPAPQPPKGRKSVDPDVADILREEAKRETDQRKKEAPTSVIESQSDLGLRDPSPAPKSNDAVGAGVAAAATAATRRELLPDIEEINSSLAPGDDGVSHSTTHAEHAAAVKRSGFRRGFFLVLVLIAVLVLIYLQAETIKTAVPALADVLDRYVASVNDGRVWLDQNVRSLLTSVSADAADS